MRSLDSGIAAAVAVDNGDLSDFRMRQKFCREYSWSIPHQESVDAIASFLVDDMTVAVGSGHGLWESWLDRAGVMIEATDLTHTRHGHVARLDPFIRIRYFESQAGCIKHLRAISPSALFLSWPPYDEPMAASYLAALMPSKVVYIGEPAGGCTGDDEFFHLLRRHYKLEWRVPIPHWECTYDCGFLYVKQRTPT